MADFLLLETGDKLLLETGDKALLEAQSFILDAQPGSIAITGFLVGLDTSVAFNPGSIAITGFDAGLHVGPVVVSCCSPVAAVNSAYNSSFIVAGGRGPYTWSKIAGNFPTGLSLNTSTGALTGTPTITGTFSFTIRVITADGNTDDNDCSITVSSAIIAGSGTYKIIPDQRFDTIYTDLSDPNSPITANTPIPTPFAETSLLGDDNEENIYHVAAVRYRVKGFGLLKSTLKGLDDSPTESLADLTMSAAPAFQPAQLANFISQRTRLRIEASSPTYYYYFNINRIVFYAKPIWTEFPR